MITDTTPEPEMTSWQQIVDQHGPLVWQTALRLVGNETDAADCFQRTFVCAMELAQTQPVRHWPALLRQISTSRALECLRRRYRERRHISASTFPDGGELSDTSAMEPFQKAAARELAEHLRATLSQINRRQAEVFCMACLDDCSYGEIASQLRVSVNYVGVLLNRAKAALRERLKSHAPEAQLP